MEFQIFVEDQQDVCAIEVAEVSASDVEEIGQQSEPESFRLATSKYADPVESVPVVTVEEHPSLVSNSRDSKSTTAAKAVLCELLSRSECSRPSVALYHKSGGMTVFDCGPSFSDFAADIFLCAKRSLPLSIYRVFCLMVDESFERWADVPASVRRMILENTGAELLRRKIWDGRSTRRYWENNFRKYGRKSAPASTRLV